MAEIEKESRGMLKYILLILIVIGVLLYLYARFVSTSGLLVKEYIVKTESTDYDGLKIVHFTDLHYRSTVNEAEVKKLVKEINKQNPDIVIFTGDLIEDGVYLSKDEINYLIKLLKGIEPKIEVIAVKGNHDYGSSYFDEITEKLGWNVLFNTYEYVYYNTDTPITFIGFDDWILGKKDYDNAFSFESEIGMTGLKIILLHEPDQIDEVLDRKWDIAFAGHSHLGQVRLPLLGAIYTPAGAKKYMDDYYEFNSSKLYVSGGIGTSKLKVRYFNRPSISLYRFMSK